MGRFIFTESTTFTLMFLELYGLLATDCFICVQNKNSIAALKPQKKGFIIFIYNVKSLSVFSAAVLHCDIQWISSKQTVSFIFNDLMNISYKEFFFFLGTLKHYSVGFNF